jgi:hypothetical protein
MELFDGAGHFPHIDDPRRFANVLHEFVTSMQPARADRRCFAPSPAGDPMTSSRAPDPSRFDRVVGVTTA